MRKSLNVAAGLKPSVRGELEIVDVLRAYLERDSLRVLRLPPGIAWLDTGTPQCLADAARFVEAVEERQNLKVGCVEEVAFAKGYITASQLDQLAEPLKNAYGGYLRGLANGTHEVSCRYGTPRLSIVASNAM